MRRKRSAVGTPISELPRVLSPLAEAMREISPERLQDPLTHFLYCQVVDAYCAGQAIRTLILARRRGVRILPSSIEVIVRRIVEQAIVASWANANPGAVNRYLNTVEKEWKRSFKTSPAKTAEKVPNAQPLPSYTDMARAVDPELGELYSKLAFLSHPRGAPPYSQIESQLKGISADAFFELRVMPLIEDLDHAVERLISSLV